MVQLLLLLAAGAAAAIFRPAARRDSKLQQSGFRNRKYQNPDGQVTRVSSNSSFSVYISGLRSQRVQTPELSDQRTNPNPNSQVVEDRSRLEDWLFWNREAAG